MNPSVDESVTKVTFHINADHLPTGLRAVAAYLEGEGKEWSVDDMTLAWRWDTSPDDRDPLGHWDISLYVC